MKIHKNIEITEEPEEMLLLQMLDEYTQYDECAEIDEEFLQMEKERRSKLN